MSMLQTTYSGGAHMPWKVFSTRFSPRLSLISPLTSNKIITYIRIDPLMFSLQSHSNQKYIFPYGNITNPSTDVSTGLTLSPLKTSIYTMPIYCWNVGFMPISSWWRHQMEILSALLALCAGNSPSPVNFPHKASDSELACFLRSALEQTVE